MKFKLLFTGYIASLICFFLYSFTQVDLSLTLSKASFWQIIQKSFQYIGFFQRPTSTIIFCIILFLLFLFYAIFLFLAKKNKLSKKQAWSLIIGLIIALGLSYNAFSYDLFNYVFDAKIVTFYNQNPFLHKPMDFASDPMLNFMRWTHRFYPYGPSWLALTIPLSYIGMNYFLLTLILFKLLITASFLGTCYFVCKISEKVFSKDSIFNLIFWGLNPLVIIEGMVSSHNEIPMLFFTLFAFYLFIVRKKTWSAVSYLFSLGIKYANIVLLPIFLALFYFGKVRKEINWEKVFLYSVLLSIASVIVASLRTTFQPWYLLYILPFAAFLAKKYYIFVPSVVLSFFASAIYIPYVYLTDYHKDYPLIITNIEIAGLAVAVITTIVFAFGKKLQK